MSIETKYRPAQSLLTVTVVSFAALGNVRDHLMINGSIILPSVKTPFSNLKALAVYSADCLSNLDLKVGYLFRLAKKLANADCKWRNACCSGTELTSFNQVYSGCFFNCVSKAEVSW